jgi:hypothetical protein
VDSTAAYALLRAALPKFLLLVGADPRLSIEQPNGSLSISFPRTISSCRHELVRFVAYDVILPFLLGLPPLAEYEHEGVYECSCDGTEVKDINGIPVTLLEIILQVNSWRAGARVYRHDWQALEQRVLSWELPYNWSEASSAATSTSVRGATVRVQEGWRHVLLIYIYMVCLQSFIPLPRIQLNMTARVYAGCLRMTRGYKRRWIKYFSS